MPAGLPYVGWVTRPDKNGQPPPCFGQCTLNIGARKVGAAMKRLPQLQYGMKAKEQFFQKWDPVSKRLVNVVFRDILLVLSSRSLTLTPLQATVGYTSNDLSRQTNTVIRDALGEIYATDTGLNENAGTYSKNYAGAVYGNETYTSTLTVYDGTQFVDSGSYSVSAITTVPNLTLDVTTGIMSSANWTISSGGRIRSGQYQFLNNSNTNSTTGGTVLSTQLYPPSGAPYTSGSVTPYYLDPSTLWNFYYGQLVLPDASFVTSPSATRYIPIAALTSLSANSVSDIFNFTWAITPNPWPLSTPSIVFTFLDASNAVVSGASFTTSLLSGSISVSRFNITNQTYKVQLSITDPLSEVIPITLSNSVTPAGSFSFITAPTVSQVSGTSATVGWTDPCNARLDVYESVNNLSTSSAEFSIGSTTTLAGNTFPTTQTITVPTINPSNYYFSRIRARDFADTTDVATSGYSNAAAGRFTRAYTNILNGGGATSNFSSFTLSSSSANPYVYTLQSPDSVTALSPYFKTAGTTPFTGANALRFMAIGEEQSTGIRFVYIISSPTTIITRTIDMATGIISSSNITTLDMASKVGVTSLTGLTYDAPRGMLYVASRSTLAIYRITNFHTTQNVATLASSVAEFSDITGLVSDTTNDTLYISRNGGNVYRLNSASTTSGLTLIAGFALIMVVGTTNGGIALSTNKNILYAWSNTGIFYNSNPRSITLSTIALSGLTSSVLGATSGLMSTTADGNIYLCGRAATGTGLNTVFKVTPVGTGSVITSITSTSVTGGVATYPDAPNYVAVFGGFTTADGISYLDLSV